jgi:hypothetical protein
VSQVVPAPTAEGADALRSKRPSAVLALATDTTKARAAVLVFASSTLAAAPLAPVASATQVLDVHPSAASTRGVHAEPGAGVAVTVTLLLAGTVTL